MLNNTNQTEWKFSKSLKRWESVLTVNGSSVILVAYDAGEKVAKKSDIAICSEYYVFSKMEPTRLLSVVWTPAPSDADQARHTRVRLDDNFKPRSCGTVMPTLVDAVFA